MTPRGWKALRARARAGMRTGVRTGIRAGSVRDRARAAVRERDAGIATIEVVILAPLLVLFIMVLVGLGQMVDARSSLDGAARDAARSGSLQGDLGTAESQARNAVADELKGICIGGDVDVTFDGTRWTPQQGIFAVQVSCQVRGLRSVGFGPKTTMRGTFSSPLDPYRRLTGG